MVDQPAGRAGPQHLRRRLPRPRQHLAVQPLGYPARGRPPRPGRRHGVGGRLCAQPHAALARARARRPCLRGHGDQVLRALPAHRRRGASRDRLAPRRPVGRARRLLLRPARDPRPGCDHPARPLDGRADPALRRRAAARRHFREAAGLRRARPLALCKPPRAGAARLALERSQQRRLFPPLLDAQGATEPRADPHARRDGVPVALRHPLGVEGARGAPCRRRRAGVGEPRRLRTGRRHDAPLRRQLELARPDLDAGQLPDRRRAAPLPDVLRRRFRAGMPHRLRQQDEARPDRPRDRTPPHASVPAQRERPPSDLRRLRKDADGPALPRPDPLLRAFPRRHRPRPRRFAPDRLDGARRAAARTQTGWTGLVRAAGFGALLLHPPHEIDPEIGERG